MSNYGYKKATVTILNLHQLIFGHTRTVERVERVNQNRTELRARQQNDELKPDSKLCKAKGSCRVGK